MGVKRFNLPDPGEGLVEAEIVTWKVAAGDTVAVNDIVVEIETAKSLVELPIPWAGTVTALLVAEGQTVEVGTPIITVDVPGAPADLDGDDGAATGVPAEAEVAAEAAGAAGDGTPEPVEPGRVANLVGYGAIEGRSRRRARKTADAPAVTAAASPAATAPAATAPVAPAPPSGPAATPPAGRVLAKPPVRKYAKDRGIDLSLVVGSGAGGIITRDDVLAYERGVAGGGAATTGTAGQAAASSAGAGGIPSGPDAASIAARRAGVREERLPIKGVRKMTAQAMVGSKFTAPHVTEFVTVDVTATMDLVARLKQQREFRDVKVTPLLVVAKALLLACRRNPGVNAVWDEQAQEIVLKHYVNLGIAAATPRGLIVPNIKDADQMSMLELAQAMGALVDTARSGRTQPAEMAGGTITITNVGVFGVDTGTPIINPGESAIVAFGAVRRTPWVMADEHGVEQIVPRWVTQLAMSFDHRLIDGDLGSRFLADLAAVLEDPAKGLVWG